MSFRSNDASPLVSLEGIFHEFKSPDGKRLEILRDLDLKIDSQQTLAILGPSGSGKSTLLSILAGLQRPGRGKVFWQDQDIASMPERTLAPIRARSIALVFQQFLLIPHLTALENTSLPLELQGTPRNEARRQGLAKLKELGLESRADHFPSMMSGGECQRVAIARAISVSPLLLLADEPTGNLDPKSAGAVFERLLALPREGHTGALIVVTHNEELARLCDRQVRLVNGHLEELNS
ncbi:MAG: hypothetical protein RJB38_879 [Pseudomonadota bacterium]|jgi:putative ABC transport system ATP-binding protein